MKHIPWMLLAVLAFATACTQDELTDNPSAMSQTLEIASATIARAEGDEATTTDAGTGTVDGNWVDGDEITVMFNDLYYTKATYTYTNGGFTSDNPIDCNGQTSFAQAWTNYGVTPNLYNGAPGQWEVETDQSGEGYRQSDFLYAGTQSYVGAGTPANFTFYHQTAKIVVHVRNSGIVAGKSGLGMTVGNDNIYIDGELGTQVNNVYIWTSGDTQGTITPYNLGQQPMSDNERRNHLPRQLRCPCYSADHRRREYTFYLHGRRADLYLHRSNRRHHVECGNGIYIQCDDRL